MLVMSWRRRRATWSAGTAARAARAIVAMALTLSCQRSGSQTNTPGAEAPARTDRLVLDGVRLLGLLEQLADDRLRGRYTLDATAIRQAADVIVAGYRESGVTPATDDGFLVDFGITVGIDPGPNTSLTLGDAPALTFDPTLMSPRPEGGVGRAEGPLVFVGYGIVHGAESAVSFDELAGVPLSGAIAVVLADVPKRPPDAKTPPRAFGRADRDLGYKLERLEKAGAVAAIVVNRPEMLLPGRDDDEGAPPELPPLDVDKPMRRRVSMPVLQLHARAAQEHLRFDGGSIGQLAEQINLEGQPRSGPMGSMKASLVVDAAPRVRIAPNILAMVPGTDLADEIVLVGAHYDHIGADSADSADGQPGPCHRRPDDAEDGICNGADDNGSGSAIVAELAKAMTAGTAPRRTVVFAHFAGEEMGLLGSRDLAARLEEQPPFAGRTVVAMLNIDMVGRLREQLTISGVGTSSGWLPLLDEVGTGGMQVLYDRSLTTRSDHAPFYEQGVPALFFFTGIHDDYHAPGDEMVGILPGGLLKVADLVAKITWRVADGAAVPFTAPTKPEEGLVPVLPGDDPANVIKIVGPDGQRLEP